MQSIDAIAAGVDGLGPELPMAVFTSSERWNPERIKTLAIYCSDGRWGEAFDEFCHRRLLIPRYDRWAVPGGPAWLVPGLTAASLRQGMQEQVGFLVRVHKLSQVVLIAHYGCAYYTEHYRERADACLPRQLADLHTAADALRGWFPELRLLAFVAMQRANCLTFHQLALEEFAAAFSPDQR